MKYQLTTLVNSLNPSESRNFKLNLDRYHSEKDKKITRLYQAIKSKKTDEYSPDLPRLIAYSGSYNAFARLKNNLTGEIENSLVALHCDKHDEFKVYKYLQLFQIFMGKTMYVQAKDYLKKAEKVAAKIEHYELLGLIAKKFIEISLHLHENPAPYIEKQKKYEDILASINQLHQLLATINYELTQTNFLSENQDILQKLNKISEELLLNDSFRNSAEIKLKVYQSIRNLLLQKRDFKTLVDYLILTFEDFEDNQIYTKNTHEKKIVHLSWIVNALPKTKQYERLPKYVNELHRTLQQYDKLFHDKYIWLYYQSRLIEYTFSNKIKEGIALMLNFETEELPNQPAHLRLYVNLNLCSLYYMGNQLDNSSNRLSLILTDNSFNKLDEEFQLRVSILELIVRNDYKDIEYAINKSREIKRKFSDFLKKEEHFRDRTFINIIIEMLKKADPFKDDKFIKKVTGFIEQSPEFEPGSNEIIDYAIWLRSKIERKNYYDLIPHLVQS